jgi:competence protein ComEC
MSIASLSYGLCINYKQLSQAQYFSYQLQEDSTAYLSVIVTEPIVINQKSIKIVTTLVSIVEPFSEISASGKLLIYIKTDTFARKLQIGENLLIKVSVSKIQEPQNPNEFDYSAYLKQENIYHSAYLKSGEWLILERKESLIIKTIIKLLSKRLENLLSLFVESKALPIANAILIGQKDDLDTVTIKRYAQSGAMHVLAVSGLHVGIVYLVFHYALFFLEKTRLKEFKPYLMLLLLWTYALITGASPSVLRATTMFSFISIGNALQQHVNIYNMIAASALVLLIVNPYVILALGFQLSYLAVIGIIYVQPKLYKLLVFKNLILDKLWTLSSVSIAAQLATFPLGMLYFHQFPNLFLISNLVVIPTAIAIVYLGMALIATSFVPYLPNLIGFVLSKTILFMNETLDLLNKIPYSNTSGIYITGLSCLLIYFFIITLVLSITQRQKYSFVFALLCLLTVILLGGYNLTKLNEIKFLRIYKVRNYSAIEFQSGFNSCHYFDEVLRHDTASLNYSIQNNWWANHLQIQQFDTLPRDFLALNFANKSILVLNSDFDLASSVIQVDYLIITHQKQLWLQDLSAKIKARNYIFDTSNNPLQIKYWKKDCEDLNLNCYFVSEEGAYEKKLN